MLSVDNVLISEQKGDDKWKHRRKLFEVNGLRIRSKKIYGVQV